MAWKGISHFRGLLIRFKHTIFNFYKYRIDIQKQDTNITNTTTVFITEINNMNEEFHGCRGRRWRTTQLKRRTVGCIDYHAQSLRKHNNAKFNLSFVPKPCDYPWNPVYKSFRNPGSNPYVDICSLTFIWNNWKILKVIILSIYLYIYILRVCLCETFINITNHNQNKHPREQTPAPRH